MTNEDDDGVNCMFLSVSLKLGGKDEVRVLYLQLRGLSVRDQN